MTDTDRTTYGPRRSAGGRTAVRGGGWPAVLAVASGSFALVLSELLPVGALSEIGADLGLSTGTTGLLVVVPGLAAAVAAPLLTVLSRGLDRRPVLWALAAATGVADLVCALAPNLAVMLVGRVLLGLALGGFWAVGAAVAPRLVPPGSVHRASSLVTAGISVGTVASLPLAALAGRTTGWRSAFWVAGLLGVAALVAQIRWLPSLAAPSATGWKALSAVPRLPAARAGLLATAFVFLGQFAAYTYIAPYLERHAHFGAGAPALLLGYGVAGIAGNFLAGLTLARSVRGTIGVAAAALAVVAALLPPCAGSPVAVCLLVLVWGALFGALPLSLQTAMLKAVPAAPESGAAVFVSVVQVSLAMGSLLGGAVVDARGIPASLTLAAVLAAAAALVVAALPRRRPAGTSPQQTVV
ncbi:MFS transporter [Streptomyces sp. NPDC101733]|uniref:MFS transporter n=1 Tax=unclassified Streptomyces TaxID=2593676 RepID=UPI00381A64CF